jgi:hypothetical protein
MREAYVARKSPGKKIVKEMKWARVDSILPKGRLDRLINQRYLFA